MADYVLIHGGNVSTDTWNNLAKRKDYPSGEQLGGKVWRNTLTALEKHGHRVFAPTLEDENTHSLTDHIEQICKLIILNNLTNLILVGHSYGGMVITGVASKIPDRVGFLVYLDAVLPDPGQSLFDILTLSGFDPIQVTGSSSKAYLEKIQFDPKILKRISKIFIFCTKSQFIPATNLARKKITNDNEGWRIVELPTSHIPQCTMPDKLNELLLELGGINNLI